MVHQGEELTPLAALAASLRGEVITPSSPEYEKAIIIWNRDNPKRPQAIFRVLGVSDVRKVLKYISSLNPAVPFTVKGGGHNLKSFSDGFVIDLGNMRSVRVDPKNKTAIVEGGAFLGDVFRETAQYGLFLPAGIVTHTGVAGLTLFGGVGWLCREFGLTLDHVEEVELVTAAGEVLIVNKDENSDLFWGVRGAGACFGVVTSFKFRLVQSTHVYAGPMLYHFPKYVELFELFRQLTLSDEKYNRKEYSALAATHDPKGNKMVAFATCLHGSEHEWKETHEPFEKAGPFVNHVKLQPTVDWFCSNDHVGVPGCWYQEGLNLEQLDPAIGPIISHAFETAPTTHTTVLLMPYGGKISEVPEDATAYSPRKSRFGINIECCWVDPADKEKTVKWTRALYEKLAPFKSHSTYINFETYSWHEGKEYFGKNVERLQELKKKYDPTGVFRSVLNP